LIGVVDYGMGNVRSVLNALEHLGADAELVGADGLGSVDKVVLPGVGAFGDAMAELRGRALVEPLREAAADGRPLLGICLGMQLLASTSREHGEHEGLRLIPGTVERIETDPVLRIPHVGWNDMVAERDSELFAGLDEEPTFYYVHSYEVRPDDAEVVTGSAPYGRPLTATIERDNVYGVQFHPEKSQRDGLKLLDNFVRLQ
jgi:glutamine amidotransferase